MRDLKLQTARQQSHCFHDRPRGAYLAIGTSALGMNHTLRDPLAVKVSKQVNQVEILKQERPRCRTQPLPAGWILDGTTIRGGVHRLFGILVGRLVIGTHFAWFCEVREEKVSFSRKALPDRVRRREEYDTVLVSSGKLKVNRYENRDAQEVTKETLTDTSRKGNLSPSPYPISLTNSPKQYCFLQRYCCTPDRWIPFSLITCCHEERTCLHNRHNSPESWECPANDNKAIGHWARPSRRTINYGQTLRGLWRFSCSAGVGPPGSVRPVIVPGRRRQFSSAAGSNKYSVFAVFSTRHNFDIIVREKRSLLVQQADRSAFNRP